MTDNPAIEAATPAIPSGSQPLPQPATDAGTSAASAADCEQGGPKGLEPTRYGDWERGGRAFDF